VTNISILTIRKYRRITQEFTTVDRNYSHCDASLPLAIWVYLHRKFLRWAPKTNVFWNRVRNGRSRSSKVIDFGRTNQKRVFISHQ